MVVRVACAPGTKGWWEIGRTTGDLLAPILGVPKGSISMHQNVTVTQAIVASCHRFDGTRRRIVMSDLEFPSNMYLFEGFRRYGAEIVYVRSDDAMRTNLERFLDAIDERTALVPVSLVLFKSAYIQQAEAIIEKAHRVGARVILDVYQAAGTVPMQLEAWGTDFAVGGSVKWLCGGPGAGYLYVRPDLAKELEPGIIGWAAHAQPFEFATGAIALRRRRRNASRAARRTCRRCYSAAPATRSSAKSACRRSARSRCA